MDDRFKDQMMLLILNTMLHVDLMCNNLLLLGISKHQSIITSSSFHLLSYPPHGCLSILFPSW